MAHRLSGVTRKELYEAVWSRPPMALCGQLVVGPELLFAICLDLVIPWPSQEYWRRRKDSLPTIRLRLTPVGQLEAHLQPRPFDAEQRLGELSPSNLVRTAERPSYDRPLQVIATMNAIAVAARAEGFRPSMPEYGVLRFSDDMVSIDCSLIETLTHRRKTLTVRFGDLGPNRKEWMFHARASVAQTVVAEIVGSLTDALLVRRAVLAAANEEARLRTLASMQRQYNSQYWKALVEAVNQRDETRRVEAFLNEMEMSAVNQSHVIGQRTVKQWIAWARGEIVRINDAQKVDAAEFWKEIEEAIWRRPWHGRGAS